MGNNFKKTIKEIPKVERAREKLIHFVPEKLSNSELLAIRSYQYLCVNWVKNIC